MNDQGKRVSLVPPSRLALVVALAAGIGTIPSARAEQVAVDAAVLEQLQQIIKQQQQQLKKQSQQLESQAKTLETLQTQVEGLQQKAYETQTIATDAQSQASAAKSAARKGSTFPCAAAARAGFPAASSKPVSAAKERSSRRRVR